MTQPSKPDGSSDPPAELSLTSSGVVLRGEQTVFGQTETVETGIAAKELDEYSISFRTLGGVSLEKFLPAVETEDAGEEATITIPVDEFDVDVETNHIEATIFGDRPQAPPTPEIDPASIDTLSHRETYESLASGRSSLAKRIRDTIHREGTLSKGELRAELDQDYSSYRSGVSRTLNVLESVTKEIERQGRGADETLQWVGTSSELGSN